MVRAILTWFMNPGNEPPPPEVHPPLPREVVQALAAITTDLGEAFSNDDLVAYVAARRGKPVQFELVPMPVGLFRGYCVPAHDVDLIRTPAHHQPLRVQISRLHQLAHLLLGHTPHVADDEELQRLYQLPTRPVDAFTPCSGGRTVREWHAETLATLLFERIQRHAAQQAQEQGRTLFPL
jgi:hypothetical protein